MTMTGGDVLDLLEAARADGDYVLITPWGHILTGPVEILAQSAVRLALLEQLPTEATKQ